MNTKILKALEFDKVKKQFTHFLQSEQGQMELNDLLPMTNQEKIERSFAEIADVAQIFQEYASFGFGHSQDISESLRRLELGADLNTQELLAVKRILQMSAELKDFYDNLENVDLQILDCLFEKIETFPDLQGSLQAINDGGFIEDFASPELTKIRHHIHQNEQQIRQILQEMLKKQGDLLAENLIASRSGRSVLPVKNTYRHRIAGVIHDISASGNTVYIEPRAVVNLNEEMTQARADERHEMTRILHDLSDRLRSQTDIIGNNAWLLGHIDFVRGKYLYMRENQASLPSLTTDQTIRLLSVRHPLLSNPIANDLHFEHDTTAILITGPNTGGKTIMLKTLGITQLMAQSGLPILADEGSKVAVFKDIFADIGDEQSIEQSLSTFSSHMTHIVEILQKANKDSLVLFDELGAGTDPQEGAALAMSILEHLRLSDIKTMITTHYPELKAYGIETEFIENASMEFDMVTLSPTYHFMQGVPGRSNAFEIARRLGLSEIIVAEAENLTNTDSDVNKIIERLENQTIESRRRLDNIREVEQENLKFNRAVKKLYNEFSHAQDKELRKAKLKAQEIVDKALAESDFILKNLQDKAQLKPHEIIEAKGKLKKLVPEIELSKNKVLKKAKKKRAAKVGDDIIVSSYGQRGTLTKRFKDGRWEAQVGLIKMTLQESEFDLVKSDKAQASQKRQAHLVKRTSQKAPSARLDLRGKRYEEAMQELDEFIDQALLNNMAQVDIIHGIGTGVIRDGVTKYLRRNKQVKEFGYAPQNAGGSGATIVTFK
ncbi:endonuclease MutS2 [Streptococcus mutans]|jgi:MutS2 family protein|uniref:Endonuclease MutS2 n=1 Tax=Streptococcus mutans serotype c (strain ATCC 700610 / UA159) TaxID=210007 RepID=MUTS2_STRMU|nr:endonuclease MutS2 [Streptococcus mutans]Q8DSD1.1 RecName: Full=Endonuclease MutS2 [Streptococcus mutans UA159]AAN59487.1 putative DNA mismatch repair protein MutS2 [Streptococcus mutans UA159]AJD56091.1 DNA mismatch repair protein MutS2 [Streptococcus mutans UA159-FR]EMB59392.1 putative DNA mismatch repair protein MutS2 [Streptococcus mutans 8ID3]EMC61102.1 putative DNA mismatch repair protein MutS2 [Streptococcus mutans U2B]EMP57701.1 DNA mismatch repair protein MutS2 [Streptococcus muta